MPQTIDNLLATWANAGTTFTAFKFNVVDNASASGSLLMDLQVGGTSRFNVSKRSIMSLSSLDSGTAGSAIYSPSTNVLAFATADASAIVCLINSTAGIKVPVNASLSWTSVANANTGSAGDLFLTRRDAASLRLGAADSATPVPQTLGVQWASGTNIAGADFTIAGSRSTGNAAGGSIIFQVAPAGSSGSAQNALATALTIGSDKAARFTGDILGLGGTKFNTTGTTYSYGFYISGGPVFGMGLYYVGLASNSSLRWSSTTDPNGAHDIFLARDDANTLALRNGANAQTFRVYNTWTSFGTGTEIWERGKFAWESNALVIGTEKGANGGAARALQFQTDGTTRLTLNTAGLATFSGTITVSGGVVRTDYINSSNDQISWLHGSDDVNGRMTFANGRTNPMFRFGGTTSSFPALKRSSTTLQARLADDSAFASVQGKLTTDTAYAAGDPTTTGYLVVYDSTGTAYKIPAVAV